jgi:antitoxin component YwqK of YwqJK toxin-antitoxin module
MKRILVLLLCLPFLSQAQIPKPQTKEERKAENKKKSLEERIEDALPVDVALPKANAKVGKTEVNSIDDAKKLLTETLPDLGLKISKKARKLKKDLTKRKPAFDGKTYEKIAVEKKIVRLGVGEKMSYEEFYIQKDNKKPNPYVKDIYWYDERSGKVQFTLGKDRTRSQILHGPYKRWIGATLVEEGFYYIGAKHKRWVWYDKNFNIIDKQYYDKGFLSDSRINYWDDSNTKIREILPVSYGKITGYYLSYHDNGVMESEGRIEDSVAVGRWVEYYAIGKKMKKEVQYGKDRYDTMEPYVIREYDEKGKLIYEHKK